MPLAPTRICGTCGTPRSSGSCPTCARRFETYRGTATKRGYGRAWIRFKPYYLNLLLERGIVPVCGAKLPEGPRASISECKAQGLLTYTSADGSALHLHHSPPLQPHERRSPALVCDPRRIELACAECHARETNDASHQSAVGAPCWGGSEINGRAPGLETGQAASVDDYGMYSRDIN